MVGRVILLHSSPLFGAQTLLILSSGEWQAVTLILMPPACLFYFQADLKCNY